MRRLFKVILIITLMIPFLSISGDSSGYAAGYTKGKVVDFFTKRPIKGAIVGIDGNIAYTDEEGIFRINAAGKMSVRAHGYMRAEQETARPLITLPVSMPVRIDLVPFTSKALYLTVYGIQSKTLRQSALKLIEDTELNTLVIDMKGDRGIVPYRSSVLLASAIGAQKLILIKDIKELVSSLKAKGIYTIARIVVFKDDPLATTRPDLAVKTTNGELWRDREKLHWVDPFKKEVWNYNIDLAIEAAQNGFDEVQFDYVRFPDSAGVAFSMPSTEENRTKAISEFLSEAKRRLIPYNVFLSADIFGYVAWNLDDTQIGQRLQDVAPILDYMSPMLYPSGFKWGIPGYKNPVANSYQIVYLTLKKAGERTNLPPSHFRPWLQAFRDYAFDRRHYTGTEIRAQIDAAEKFGSGGWMLWNPRNVYTADGLKRKRS